MPQKPHPRDSGMLRNHCGLQGTFPGALPLISSLQPGWNGDKTPLSTQTGRRHWKTEQTEHLRIRRKGINSVIWTCYTEPVWLSHTKVLFQRSSLVLSSPNSTRSPRVWHQPAASTISIHPQLHATYGWGSSFRSQAKLSGASKQHTSQCSTENPQVLGLWRTQVLLKLLKKNWLLFS